MAIEHSRCGHCQQSVYTYRCDNCGELMPERDRFRIELNVDLPPDVEPVSGVRNFNLRPLVCPGCRAKPLNLDEIAMKLIDQCRV